MIERKLYVCELCGTQYKEKLRCKTCEESHVKPLEIKDCKYISIDNNRKGYPTHLHVKMGDGTVQIYKKG